MYAENEWKSRKSLRLADNDARGGNGRHENGCLARAGVIGQETAKLNLHPMRVGTPSVVQMDSKLFKMTAGSKPEAVEGERRNVGLRK